jgi:hypothetical protein
MFASVVRGCRAFLYLWNHSFGFFVFVFWGAAGIMLLTVGVDVWNALNALVGHL